MKQGGVGAQGDGVVLGAEPGYIQSALVGGYPQPPPLAQGIVDDALVAAQNVALGIDKVT